MARGLRLPPKGAAGATTVAVGGFSSIRPATEWYVRGDHVVRGLGAPGGASNGWQQVFAAMGALVIGLTAAVRLAGSDRLATKLRRTC